MVDRGRFRRTQPGVFSGGRTLALVALVARVTARAVRGPGGTLTMIVLQGQVPAFVRRPRRAGNGRQAAARASTGSRPRARRQASGRARGDRQAAASVVLNVTQVKGEL